MSPLFCKENCQISSYTALAHAPLSTHDNDLVLDMLQPLPYLGILNLTFILVAIGFAGLTVHRHYLYNLL